MGQVSQFRDRALARDWTSADCTLDRPTPGCRASSRRLVTVVRCARRETSPLAATRASGSIHNVRQHAAGPGVRSRSTKSCGFAPQQPDRLGSDERQFFTHLDKCLKFSNLVGVQLPFVIAVHQFAQSPIGMRRQLQLAHRFDPFSRSRNYRHGNYSNESSGPRNFALMIIPDPAGAVTIQSRVSPSIFDRFSSKAVQMSCGA